MEMGKFTSFLKKVFLKIKWFSLVNLVMGEEIVREYFQENCTSPVVAQELSRILQDNHYRESMLENYKKMLKRLGPPGCAHRTAEEMVAILGAK
jgi:lipid-A-disaccharide synthase